MPRLRREVLLGEGIFRSRSLGRVPVMNQELLTLSTICQGSAEEIFLRELQKVCENIADPNTSAKAARSITLEFKIKPFEDRSGAQIVFDCKSKVPGVATQTGQM